MVVFVVFNCDRNGGETRDIAGLELSTDTVFFDTVFTSIGSATQVFKMYNTTNQPMLINDIKLAGGDKSIFRINLNGTSGIDFEDIEILPNDSQFFFLEVTVDPNDDDLPFVAKDSIWFEGEDGKMDVKLIAWGQNAYFHREEIIVDNTTWPTDKPHVLFGENSVALGATLTIPAGCRIHGHSFSRLNIWRGSTISAIGTAEEPIVFQGDRLDEGYEDLPGQWIGIRMRPGAAKGEFANVTIKNGFIGLQVDSMPKSEETSVFFQNSTISTMNLFGLLAYAGNIEVVNTEFINSCGYLFAGEFGGKYVFANCTFGGFQKNCTRSDASVFLSNANFVDIYDVKYKNELSAVFTNCIIYGNQDEEIEISLSGDGEVEQLVFDHCLLKTEISELDTNNNILNKDPKFTAPGLLNYQLDTLSPAIGKARIIATISKDRLGNERDPNFPDIGAFERQE